MNRTRVAAGLALVGLGVLVPAGLASAHPLGNLTVNTSADIVVGVDRVTVDEVLDLAELPTVQARQQIDADGDSQVSPPEGNAYRAGQCAALLTGITLEVGGQPLALAVTDTALTFPPGQAGLPTLRLTCRLEAPSRLEGPAAVRFTDHNLTDRVGWREVVLNGDGVTLEGADAPTTSPSAFLTAYPTDGRMAPRVLAAQATASPGGAVLDADRQVVGPSATANRPQARGSDGLTELLAGIVGGRQLGVAAGAFALAVALLLGGLHSLAPGHGKSVMAAAVVGRRGSGRQVLAIGATVAATHTVGVLALGTTLWVSQAFAPDRLLPWLTAASGVLLALAGAALLVRRLLGRGGHHHPHLFAAGGHAHVHGHHDHHHHDHEHPHQHDHEHPHQHGDHHGHPHPPAPGAPSQRWLVTMGLAGGLVPTPSALVVLLGATALGRAWFGVLLVAVYGVGMAMTLLGAGLLLVRLQGWLERRFLNRRWWATLLRVAPVATAAVLLVSGLTIALRGLATA